MAKIGTVDIPASELISTHYGNTLRGVCDYLNTFRSDILPNSVIQITPEYGNIETALRWIVVYRWKC